MLYLAEGEEVGSRTLAEVQAIYRGVSQTAYSFMIELDGVPVGECQLRRMNLERCLSCHQDKGLRRIDIVIGENASGAKASARRRLACSCALASRQRARTPSSASTSPMTTRAAVARSRRTALYWMRSMRDY